MEEKYLLVIKKSKNKEPEELRFCKIKDISAYLNIPVHICRKIVELTENRHNNIKPHHRNRKLYENIRITEIPRKLKNI